MLAELQTLIENVHKRQNHASEFNKVRSSSSCRAQHLHAGRADMLVNISIHYHIMSANMFANDCEYEVPKRVLNNN